MKTQSATIKKGLSRKAAVRAFSKTAKSDFRGVKYDKSSGKVKAV